MQSDTKIFREVNALSRLSHRNIVRYYTTWVETYEPSASASASVSGSDSGDASSEDVMTSVPTLSHRNRRKPIRTHHNTDSEGDDDDNDSGASDSDESNSNEHHLPVNGTFRLNIGDFDDVSVSRSSFPSIHFSSRTSSPGTGEDDDGESTSSSGEGAAGAFAGLFNRSRSRSASGPLNLALTKATAQMRKEGMTPRGAPAPAYTPPVSRTLYIQMEFVERQTLREVCWSVVSREARLPTFVLSFFFCSGWTKALAKTRPGGCSSRS